jgi:hypothetical protein
MSWHMRDGTLVVDPHGTLGEVESRPSKAEVAEQRRRDAQARVLEMIARDHERHPVCDLYGVRVATCLACGGRGCTEALRAALSRSRR